MKARFLELQPPVKTVESDGKTYVFICLNEQQEEDTYDYPDGTGQPVTFYEYDYNEFCDMTENLDLEDINANPEKYLDYAASKEDDLERKIAEVIEKNIVNNLLTKDNSKLLSALVGVEINERLETIESKME